MKDLYDISQKQLITLWAFAIAFAFYADNTYNDILGAISVVLFFGVVFYTFGWRSNQKS